MKITLLAIGKKHDPKLQTAIEDYSKRLSHYCTLEWRLLEAKITASMSSSQIIAQESATILSTIPEQSTVILLDETGNLLGSIQLASKLQTYMSNGTKQLTIIIGGAFGVSDQIKQRADFTWSLSKLVFPHQLVRLILVEQLYRAHTILAGEKYHHI